MLTNKLRTALVVGVTAAACFAVSATANANEQVELPSQVPAVSELTGLEVGTVEGLLADLSAEQVFALGGDLAGGDALPNEEAVEAVVEDAEATTDVIQGQEPMPDHTAYSMPSLHTTALPVPDAMLGESVGMVTGDILGVATPLLGFTSFASVLH